MSATYIRTAWLAALALAAAAGPARAAPKGSPWGANYFPNVPLVTHDGRTVKLYDDLIRDKHVVFSFIFTNCTKQCAPITANLARVQRALGDRVGKDIFFYSVTLDPERDTPEKLKEYAQAYKAGPGWTFLTGSEADIALVRKKFGDLSSVENHSANVNIGNDTIGQWMATSALDNPNYLAGVIGDWLDPEWKERRPARSYADAPPIPKLGEAEKLFRAKCVACHEPGGRGVGPDLAGVVGRRSREWLTRWVMQPDRLIAEKDPIAMEILAQHKGVPMPNVDVSEAEARALVDFMATLGRPASKPQEDAQGRQPISRR